MKKVAPICSNLSRKQGVAVTWTALTGRKVQCGESQWHFPHEPPNGREPTMRKGSYSEELVKHEAGWIVNRRQAQDLSRAIHVFCAKKRYGA